MKNTILLCLLCSSVAWAQKAQQYAQKQWVDSVYHSLSFEERLGQLFMVAAYSNKDEAHLKSLEKLVLEQKVGGLIFFQGGPRRQAQMTNSLQKLAKTPMLIGIDAEWGLSMRLDSTFRFPFNMTLGAVQDMKLLQKTGVYMGLQSKRLGVHFNFGPVVDININPKNPIIGVRSFGETREIVADRAVAIMQGYQSQHLFSTAKHFPGHGDTSTDSHYKLPLIDLSKDRLDRVELYPYRRLIDEGLASVMVAHLSLPAVEPDVNLPTSLSHRVITGLLKEELGFEGLIFTDALNMKAAANYLKPGEIDLKAFLAGNDMMLFSENVPVALAKFKEAFDNQEFSEERLAYSVKKVLSFKYKADLNTYKPIELNNLTEDLNNSVYADLNRQLYNQALTLLKNERHVLPFKHLEKERMAYVKMGDDSGDSFYQALGRFADITYFDATATDFDRSVLKEFTQVIIGYHKLDNPWKNHDFTPSESNLIQAIASQNSTVVVSFAKAYALAGLRDFGSIEGLIQAFQNNEYASEAAAQIIFGTVAAKGKLPVTINSEFEVGNGLKTKTLNRLGFSSPQQQGMNADKLAEIDALAQQAVHRGLTPGLQVLVARHGQVVYQKSFGYLDYTKQQQVTNSDVYDLASLTKILATVPLLMKLYDQGKISMKSTLGQLIPEFKNTDKANINLEDVLTHQARLTSWIPFYKATLDENNKPSKQWYAQTYSKDFPHQVSEHLFIKESAGQEIINKIGSSALLPKKEYKYSDLGFIALKRYIEATYRKSLDQLVQEQFYKKLGAATLTYNPLRSYDISKIAPTEVDQYYRYTTIRGYVHDMTAAMEGGVSGHAGLFANALDVAKMMQLFMQKGEYGEERFFTTSTFEAFNNCIYCKEGNRRGVGFDKPQLGSSGPTCGCTSKDSFGHTGFTGTMAWADPEKELVYVFLSNRTFPDSSDNKLSKANIREDIQRVIYESLID